MRFRSLHLLKYGGFTDHRLDFGAVPGRLHLIYGRNESGKSTTLRAIAELLFGFGRTTQDDYIHDKKALRVGAVLVDGAGRETELYRRKGEKRTLLDANDRELGADPFEPLLGAVDRPTFERLFGLDHERLRRGGEELLRGEGDVALGLFQAAAGVASVRDVQEALSAEADALFRPRGSTQVINEAVRRLADERARIRQASVSAETYHKLEQELADVERQVSAQEESARDLESRRRQRERVRRNLAPLALRRALLLEAETLADVPNLSEEATKRRLEAEEKLHRASAKWDQSSARALELEVERGASPVSETVLAAEAKVRRLARLLTIVTGATDDLPKREATESLARQHAERLIRDARFDVPVTDAEPALPPAPRVQMIRRVADERESLGARLAELRAQLLELEGERGAKVRALSELPDVVDPAALERSVKEVLSLGQLEQGIERLTRAAATQSEELEQVLRSLPHFSGTLAQLRELAVPVDATVERFARLWQDRTSELEAMGRRLDEAREATARQREELAFIEREGELPTEAAVSAARRRRDEGWALVRRAHIDASEDVAVEANAYDSEHGLAEAYEVAVAYADRLGDRRQAETARVTRFEQGQARLELCRANEVAWGKRLGAAQGAAAELESEWTREWLGLGRAPLPPLEMRDWLRERRAVLARADGLAGLEADQRDTRTKLDRACGELRRVLESFGPPSTDGLALGELLEAAELRARELRMGVERLRNLREALSQLDTKRETLRVRIADAERELETWSSKWEAALSGLGRGVDSHIVEIRALLDVIEELRMALARWRDLDQRVRAMRADRAALEAAVGELTSELAPELGSRPLLDAAERLVAMVAEARESLGRRDRIDAELERAARETAAARGEIEAAERVFAHLCEQAGCQHVGELEAIEAKVARKKRAEQELHRVERELLSGGEGLSLDELVREAEGGEIEAVRGELERIEVDFAEARDRVKPLIVRRTELRQALSLMTGTDTAAEGAQRAEGLVASLREDVEHWFSLKIATEVLKRGLERYRERNQGPLIGRASEHFQGLTIGRYRGLGVDYDAHDRPILEGVLADGRHVAVAAMSDGTRDQLYLALRLAVLQQLARKGEALPVTFDDVLVHFDDERASAALRALSELAQRTQVLYFTHHARVLDLARQHLESERLMIHSLPG